MGWTIGVIKAMLEELGSFLKRIKGCDSILELILLGIFGTSLIILFVGIVIALYFICFFISLLFWIAFASIFLWLISLTGIYQFQLLHGIILGFAIKILKSILSISVNASSYGGSK